MNDWQQNWDWARDVWGDNSDFSFNDFFRDVASQVAEYEGLDELGSSDVWHLNYSCVQAARRDGVDSRARLEQFVRDYQGCR